MAGAQKTWWKHHPRFERPGSGDKEIGESWSSRLGEKTTERPSTQRRSRETGVVLVGDLLGNRG